MDLAKSKLSEWAIGEDLTRLYIAHASFNALLRATSVLDSSACATFIILAFACMIELPHLEVYLIFMLFTPRFYTPQSDRSSGVWRRATTKLALLIESCGWYEFRDFQPLRNYQSILPEANTTTPLNPQEPSLRYIVRSPSGRVADALADAFPAISARYLSQGVPSGSNRT